MPKLSNQKLKLLYLMKILREKTDEEHPLSISDIQAALDSYGVSAERKSLYDDIEALQTFGLDIVYMRGRPGGYFLANREFELPELKLLVDAVQSSRFITHKKSSELIKKLESLASRYDAQLLQRQVYVANRIKTMNESVYYNVDKIHAAIAGGKKIEFRYFDYGVDKKPRYRRGGEKYIISPCALAWDDENYYMVGYDAGADTVKHFRVDRMSDIEVSIQSRDPHEIFETKFDLALYSRRMFGMFGGELANVKLEFDESLANVVIDRFGKDIPFSGVAGGKFTVTAKVAVSPVFFAWMFDLGEKARIISPENVVQEYKSMLAAALALYGEGGR